MRAGRAVLLSWYLGQTCVSRVSSYTSGNCLILTSVSGSHFCQLMCDLSSSCTSCPEGHLPVVHPMSDPRGLCAPNNGSLSSVVTVRFLSVTDELSLPSLCLRFSVTEGLDKGRRSLCSWRFEFVCFSLRFC